jgi:hypothetical protein
MYHYPLLSSPDLGFIRSPGPGLGNLLFPITRALQAAKIKEEVFVRPTMFNLKIGPLIRWEKDLRLYNKELKRRNYNDWINFLRVFFLKNKVVIHSGLGNFFHDINKSELLIKNWLLLNTLEKPINNTGKIAVHIRRGDFNKNNESQFSHQIPTQWYIDVVDRLLSKVDREIILYSDSKVSNDWSTFGSRVMLSQNISACSNILSMSTADVLVASRSTFSMWSYFLSKQKTLLPKGFDLKKYLNETRNVYYV